MTSIIPALATIISISLFISLVKQYKSKRKAHQLFYALSLLMFSLATFGEWYAELYGFNEVIYKVYYFNAISLVGIMASGTAFLLFRNGKWLPFMISLYFSILTVWLLILIIPVQPYPMITGQGLSIGGEGMPEGIRSFSFPLSGVGGILILIGSLYSYWKTKFRSNLFIAGGTLVMSLGGRFAAMGLTHFLTQSELIGVILLYYGVIIYPTTYMTTKEKDISAT